MGPRSTFGQDLPPGKGCGARAQCPASPCPDRIGPVGDRFGRDNPRVKNPSQTAIVDIDSSRKVDQCIRVDQHGGVEGSSRDPVVPRCAMARAQCRKASHEVAVAMYASQAVASQNGDLHLTQSPLHELPLSGPRTFPVRLLSGAFCCVASLLSDQSRETRTLNRSRRSGPLQGFKQRNPSGGLLRFQRPPDGFSHDSCLGGDGGI